jgi:hypothetical protein
MESHPEEFRGRAEAYYERWVNHIDEIREHGNETDKALIVAKLRDIRMTETHERVMDELLNGPDRRRKQEEEAEYERHLVHAASHSRQQQLTFGTPYTDMNPTGNLGARK